MENERRAACGTVPGTKQGLTHNQSWSGTDPWDLSSKYTGGKGRGAQVWRGWDREEGEDPRLVCCRETHQTPVGGD